MKTKVSFVILSHNDAGMVISAVNSIKRMKTRHKFDIFVVDNGSKDRTPEKIKKKFNDVKVIELPDNIGTAAYDAAIKKSNSEYIFFTGCDVEFKKDMLDMLVGFLDRNKAAAQVAPKYADFYSRRKTDLGGTWLSRSFYSGTFKDDTLGKEAIEIPYIGTGLIRNSVIKKFGYLFDNGYFFYGEDVDLGMRIRLAGFKVYYMPSAIAYHRGSISRKIHNPAFLTYLMERNLLRTFFKVFSMKNLILFIPYVMLARAVAIARDLLLLRFGGAFSRIKAIWWVIANFNLVIEGRREAQRIRKVGDNEILKFFSERYLFGIGSPAKSL